MVVYCVLLFLVLIANAGLFIALNVMARLPYADGVLLDRYSDTFFFIIYLGPGVALWIDTLLEFRARAFRPAAIGIGALASLGSIGGVLTLGAAAALPAAQAFTLSNILSLLVAAVVSVLFLGEERNAKWWTMMALALGAVILVSNG